VSNQYLLQILANSFPIRINSLETTVQPRLSERRLKVLQLVAEHPEHSLYSFNAPMPWVGGVTLLGLMAWLNMSSEIMCLLEFTQGLLEVNAMDEHGATPLMCTSHPPSLQCSANLMNDYLVIRCCERRKPSSRSAFGGSVALCSAKHNSDLPPSLPTAPVLIYGMSHNVLLFSTVFPIQRFNGSARRPFVAAEFPR